MAVCSYSRSSNSLSYLGTCGEEVHALVSCLHGKLAVTSVALFSAFPIEVGGKKERLVKEEISLQQVLEEARRNSL